MKKMQTQQRFQGKFCMKTLQETKKQWQDFEKKVETEIHSTSHSQKKKKIHSTSFQDQT